MKKIVLSILTVSSVLSFAQNKKDLDREAIKSMAGCYKVTFNFTETFSPDTAYVKHEDYHSWAYELAKVIKDTPDEIDIQHLLVVGAPGNEQVVKHWRQDWKYENTDLLKYIDYNAETKAHTWDVVHLPKSAVKGQWTQKVYQVDDSPRYEGTATWVHYDGRHYWENTTDAPLPRREYTKRGDYNVTERRNRQEIIDGGWIHEQDNKKVLRKDGKDLVIAEEKGWNTYERVDDKYCDPAVKWWEENKDIWKMVRNGWNDKYNTSKKIILRPRIERDRMYNDFFSLTSESTPQDVKNIIVKYTVTD